MCLRIWLDHRECWIIENAEHRTMRMLLLYMYSASVMYVRMYMFCTYMCTYGWLIAPHVVVM